MGKTMMTVDGNTAASYVAYAFTDVAAIYPITPSSTMAEVVDEWSAQGRKNIFGQTVNVVEMQSEAGAAGAFHGSLQAGALTTTFTASQGLLLMIPNMYKVAGELLPGVFHVSARALAAQALNIFGDHQDVMATRQTGCAMLATGSVQEVMDLAPVAHLAAIKGRIPFVHFFDGFRTSHEIQKVEAIDYDDFAKLVDQDALKAFRDNALSPNHPVTRGTAQNPDIYFQTREASNKFYNNLVPVVEEYIGEINKLTGRNYGLFNYYGADDAEDIIIAMGSVTETIEQTIEELNKKGAKYGVVKVHLYRPFSTKHLLAAIPSTVKRICVLDRTKEPGSAGEPLYLDVCSAFYGKADAPTVIGGRYGLGSKDTTPTDIKAVFDNLVSAQPKTGFTVGINDDVTFTSLTYKDELKIAEPGTVRCKFWGLGSDGTVGANKQAIKIIGNHTDKYAQAYFAYDSKKSGGVTISHLRFGDTPIRSTYLIDEADYIACHNQSYVHQYDLLKGLKKGGVFVLNCIWDESELEANLPAHMKKYIADNEIRFYIVNATKIAGEVGLGNRINMVMQSAFFKLANIISEEDAIKYLKEAVVKAYGKKGEKVVNMNYAAIDRGFEAAVKVNVPASWASAVEEAAAAVDEPEFITNILRPMNAQEGDKLPVSAFNGLEDGTFPAGTAAYEKRGIAIEVPEWEIENCIQCNQCSYVCPHATIRPFLINEKEKENAPEGMKIIPANGFKGEAMYYMIGVTPLDCTGCGNCVETCPAPGKALIMKPQDSQHEQIECWNYAVEELSIKPNPMKKTTVKGSQFEQPLLEYNGACAGCGETPYAKLVTQLFGDRMMISNATGCSSIWAAGGSAMAYTANKEGNGPAWANSLFEDNAEYGLGMLIAVKTIRTRIANNVRKALETDMSEETKAVLQDWLDNMNVGEGTRDRANKLEKVLQNEDSEIAKKILNDKEFFVKRSQWIFGGDGWAYDIGYGGLDHVLASGEDVNVLVFDTEVYSNTGGQSSKSTPTAAVAKFAASGKRTKKKDLGAIAMTYGYIYVAQVAMGADKNQTIKAITEAESYDGPSLVIAYAPCIAHGIKIGMSNSQEEERRAVDCGYWTLYRYNPELQGKKNPFSLDSKEPKANFRDFLMGEVRYASLAQTFPETAEMLFKKTEEDALERYTKYKKLASEE